MDSDKINNQTRAIVLGMVGYSQREAISILTAAISMIASQSEQVENRLDEPCMAFNSYLLRRKPGRFSLVEYDTEVKEFINAFDRYYTSKDLLALIEKRFGKKRTPSKSSLGRYLQKIARVTALAKGEGNS